MLNEALRRFDPRKNSGEGMVTNGPSTGSELAWNQERVEIQALIEAAEGFMSDGAPYQDLLEVEGIELVEDYDPENTEDCVGYALGRVMDEEWAKDYYAAELLERDPYKVLGGNNFELVDKEPNAGDVIAYGFSTGDVKRSMRVNHVGIYQGEGVVHSKFSAGPVLQHRWDQVPFYGDKVFFFRKK